MHDLSFHYVFDFSSGVKKPVATIAFQGPNIGVSVCRPTDRFTKEEGRIWSAGRAVTHQPYKIPRRIIKDQDGVVRPLREVVDSFVQKLEATSYLP